MFPPGDLCDPGWSPAVYEVTTPRGDVYTITITIPVDDGSGLMQDASYGPEIDGTPCQRVGVQVSRAREFFFARPGGAESEGGRTTMGAVGRSAAAGDDGEYASLIVLHRSACIALEGFGSGPSDAGIWVNSFTDSEGEYYPGVITVDSHRDTCTNPNQIIQTNGGGSIYAEDHIFSFQLRQNPGSDNVAYAGSVTPTPEPGRRITRAPVDHPYNCLATYPSDRRWSPNHSTSVSDAGSCEDAGEIPPYLKNLYDAYQGITASNLPSGDWAVISGSACNGLTGVFGPSDDHPAGTTGRLWYIDCGGPQGFRPTDVVFNGVDAIVTRHKINFNSDLFQITGGSSGAVLYIQNEGLEIGGNSQTVFEDVFVYIDNGPLDATSNIDWSAPLGSTGDACEAYDASPVGAPPAGCFSPLALWSNKDVMHRLGGNGAVVTAGSFFTPNSAPFRLRGGSGSDYTRSQFFAGRLSAGGGGTVTMIPNPDTNIEIPLSGSTLIR